MTNDDFKIVAQDADKSLHGLCVVNMNLDIKALFNLLLDK